MSDKESDFIFENLNKIDKKLAIQFGNTEPEKRREFVLSLEPILEGYSEYTDNYSSIYELTGDKYKILNKLYNDYEGKVPPESSSRLFSIQKKYPFISREDMVNYFSKVDEYRNEQKKQDEYEIGKRERKEEVKKWPWYKNFLTNEYGKSRYISEPEKSVWGEGSYLNKGDDIRDMILGGTAAVSELVPGWFGAISGPIIRGTRDALNYNEPYGKEKGDLVKDIGSDFLTNILIQKLPNFRREKRITSDIGGKNVTESIALDDFVSTMKKDLDNFVTPKELDAMTSQEIYDRINSLSDSELKTQLLKYAPNRYQVSRDGIAKELERAMEYVSMAEKSPTYIQGYKNAMDDLSPLQFNTKDVENFLKERGLPPPKNKEELEQIQKMIQDEWLPKEAFGSREYESRLLNKPNLTKKEKAGKVAALGTRKLLNDFGDQSMRIATDIGIIPGKRKNEVEGPNINYTRDFLLGFVPSEDAPLEIRKAYEQWREEYKKKYKVYPEEDNLARLGGE